MKYEIELTPALKAAAWKAIKAVYEAEHSPGGLRQQKELLVQKISEGYESAGRRLYDLAVATAKEYKRPSQHISAFKQLCDGAEERLKEAHEITSIKDPERGIHSWPVQKSNIIRGVREFGLSVLDYDSEYEFRKAWQAKKLAAEPKGVEVPMIGKNSDGTLRLHDLESLFTSTLQLDVVPGKGLARIVADTQQAKKRKLDAISAAILRWRKELDEILKS